MKFVIEIKCNWQILTLQSFKKCNTWIILCTNWDTKKLTVLFPWKRHFLFTGNWSAFCYKFSLCHTDKPNPDSFIFSSGFKPTNLGSRGEHVTPRPPRPTSANQILSSRLILFTKGLFIYLFIFFLLFDHESQTYATLRRMFLVTYSFPYSIFNNSSQFRGTQPRSVSYFITYIPFFSSNEHYFLWSSRHILYGLSIF